jgi:hypothetical protein
MGSSAPLPLTRGASNGEYEGLGGYRVARRPDITTRQSAIRSDHGGGAARGGHLCSGVYFIRSTVFMQRGAANTYNAIDQKKKKPGFRPGLLLRASSLQCKSHLVMSDPISSGIVPVGIDARVISVSVTPTPVRISITVSVADRWGIAVAISVAGITVPIGISWIAIAVTVGISIAIAAPIWSS